MPELHKNPILELTIFELADCPYCREERELIAELEEEHPEYGDMVFNRINEDEHPELLGQYDYYYVPSIFLGKKKLYEAAPLRSRADAKQMINAALAGVL